MKTISCTMDRSSLDGGGFKIVDAKGQFPFWPSLHS
jgi:hypothetical protein